MIRYGEIYIITNKINGKQYVGQTIQPIERRFKQHKFRAKQEKSQEALSIAIREFGANAFEVCPVASCCDAASLNKSEILIISQMGTMVPNGYNLRDGGHSHNQHPETRAKLSKALKGKPRSKESIAAQSAAQKGRTLSQETKDKIASSHMGLGAGCPQPKEHVEARRKACMKPVIDHNGIIYPSARALAEAIGASTGHVSGVLKGKLKTCKGYAFTYYAAPDSKIE